MKISTILDYIDNGHMALPEFQRGYVWGREQVRGLFESLYRRLSVLESYYCIARFILPINPINP